jgi:hypothetical protein
MPHLFWQYADLFIDVSCFNIVTSAAGTIFFALAVRPVR